MGKEVEASKGNSTTNGINNTKFNNTNTHSILQVVKRYRHGKHVLIAELYRPCSKNAFNDLMYQQLIEAIEEVNGIPDLYALVITGNGSFFTAGADLKEGIEKNKKGIMTLPSKGYAHQFMKVFLNCNKLIIAAVNGPAIGIGVTLLLHSDFVFASDTATFWIPFMRLGLVPEFASSIVLPQIVVSSYLR
jgi:enoyl-CoA hydratase/carnithine racemase